MKKIFSILLVIMLVLSMGTTVFADSRVNSVDNGFSVTQLSPNSYLMISEDESGVITMEETETDAMVTIESNENSEIEGYFHLNKVDGTIYSSYTNSTVLVQDIISKEDVMTRAVGDIVATNTYTISYAALANTVTPTSSDISLAGAIITIIAAVEKVPIATAGAVLVAIFGTAGWDTVRKGIISKDTNHGIKVTVITVEIEKHQGGALVKGYKYEVDGLRTY